MGTAAKPKTDSVVRPIICSGCMACEEKSYWSFLGHVYPEFKLQPLLFHTLFHGEFFRLFNVGADRRGQYSCTVGRRTCARATTA